MADYWFITLIEEKYMAFARFIHRRLALKFVAAALPVAGMLSVLPLDIVGISAADAADTPSAPTSRPTTQPVKAYKDIDVTAFETMMKQPNAVVLDVRTADEFAAGHIKGALNIDVNGPDFAKRVAELDKSKVYLVQCRSGTRSVKACNELAGVDFPQLYNLLGGINAWQTAGKPVEK